MHSLRPPFVGDACSSRIPEALCLVPIQAQIYPIFIFFSPELLYFYSLCTVGHFLCHLLLTMQDARFSTHRDNKCFRIKRCSSFIQLHCVQNCKYALNTPVHILPCLHKNAGIRIVQVLSYLTSNEKNAHVTRYQEKKKKSLRCGNLRKQKHPVNRPLDKGKQMLSEYIPSPTNYAPNSFLVAESLLLARR